MAYKVRMPKVDANVDEGTVGTWFVDEGDRVKCGDQLVEIITDKATFQVESEFEGCFRRKVAPEKSVLPVGYVLGLITANNTDTLPDVDEENRRIMQEYRGQMLFGGGEDTDETAQTDSESAEDQTADVRGEVRATPVARRVAREHGIDVADVAPRAEGIIRKEDVDTHLRDKKK